MHDKAIASSDRTLVTRRLRVEHDGRQFWVSAPDTEIVGAVAINPLLQLVVLRRSITRKNHENCWPDATEIKLFAPRRDGSWQYIDRPTTVPTQLIPALAGILARIPAAATEPGQ